MIWAKSLYANLLMSDVNISNFILRLHNPTAIPTWNENYFYKWGYARVEAINATHLDVRTVDAYSHPNILFVDAKINIPFLTKQSTIICLIVSGNGLKLLQELLWTAFLSVNLPIGALNHG